MSDRELQKAIARVGNVFDVDRILAQGNNEREVVDYYTESSLGYRLFHSSEGSIHMALNPEGEFNREGYFGQARRIQQVLARLKARNVLELASGKGFNSLYLAEKNPNVEFVGVDLTPAHVQYAQRRARQMSNLVFDEGDFHQLTFADDSFDLVFVVESICHAFDMPLALSEVSRVLRPGGLFIVIDGFRTPNFEQLSPDAQLASRLVEHAMSVGFPWSLDDWLKLAKDCGFAIVEIDDLTSQILPNLRRFQRMARGFFRYPGLSRILLRILPRYLVGNAVAGLLMPLTVQRGAQGYFEIVLTKPTPGAAP